jgi:hypothetical protein
VNRSGASNGSPPGVFASSRRGFAAGPSHRQISGAGRRDVSMVEHLCNPRNLRMIPSA